ncbi:hypothetical protein X546_12390 [Brevibacillus borstelensis cifa_chp40]|nr:hypothetical protein X546_12390 [Brevibacillus borstelensis cifa_chp40]
MYRNANEIGKVLAVVTLSCYCQDFFWVTEPSWCLWAKIGELGQAKIWLQLKKDGTGIEMVLCFFGTKDSLFFVE